jgi:5-methyltetrahydropteroyltriglutamate--homocysteine methyltransferase
MTPRATPPFRADHVGSLLRPARLKRAREAFGAGEIDARELQDIEDDAIAEAVEMQRAVGLASATDGEFRRGSWHMDFIYRLGGVTRGERQQAVRFHNPAGDLEFAPATPTVTEKVGVTETIFGEDFAFLRDQVAEGVTAKQTIPSPNMLFYRGGRAAIDERVYPDLDEFWSDLTTAYAQEVAGLAALGSRYLQFDDTSLAYLNDPEQRALIASIGGDPASQHRHNIAHINAALADRPAGLSVTVHMCRGNYRSSWVAEGGYDYVAEALFSDLDVDGFFLEYDDARSGDFAPLRFVPRGKQVVLGLLTTKRGELEDADELKRRIELASHYVDLDQLCLSPQCGFSSTEEGNDLTYDQQVAKLNRVIEVAGDVWG